MYGTPEGWGAGLGERLFLFSFSNETQKVLANCGGKETLVIIGVLAAGARRWRVNVCMMLICWWCCCAPSAEVRSVR
jgi:hypothetical protein